MTLTPRNLLIVGGLVLLAVGLILGFTPVSASGRSCGQIFGGSGGLFAPASCQAERGTRVLITWLTLGIGAVALILGFIAKDKPKE